MEIYNSDLTDGEKAKEDGELEHKYRAQQKLKPMRIIIGNNGMWFTPDHYITVIRIKF